MSEQQVDEQQQPAAGPGVIQPKVYVVAKHATAGSTLTVREKKAITAARKREKHEKEEQEKLLRLIFCGHIAAEEGSNQNLFQYLQSVLSVGEYEIKSASSPAGLVKLKLAEYFYNPSFTFQGGLDDLAGEEKNPYIVQLLDAGQLDVPPSIFERPGLVDDEEPPEGEFDAREFVIHGGRVLVSKEITLSLELPGAQVRLSYYLTTLQ